MKNTSNSLLANNIVWFTHSGWVERLFAFGQIYRFFIKS